MASNCVITWWNFPDITFRCIEKITSPSVTTQSQVSLGIETWVGMLFVLCAGLLGITIVELLYNRTDWFADPLCNRVVRRYRWTLERNRLETMQGHP